MKNLLTAHKPWGLVLRIVILLAIPYAFLMLCGLIFDTWLHLYGATPFIFFTLIALYIAALVLIVFVIIWFCKAGQKEKKKKK